MILFVNFAPLHFGGGAERWMIDVASEMSKSEDVILMDVHQNIANIYGRIVLKRNFNKRIEVQNTASSQHISLNIPDLVPFTLKWKKIRDVFSKSRRIYIRFELLETLIVLYFGGFSTFKKTITGVHSPFIYLKPLGILDYVHNIVYTSFLSKWILSMMYKIHVLNEKDRKFFTETFRLSNVVKIPNYISLSAQATRGLKKNKDKKLHILFVGELNIRKGIDILIDVIKTNNKDFIFHIAGDGPLKIDIENLLALPNIKYYGYLNKNELSSLYNSVDVLFMPSRAESFSLVCLEAMSHGLLIASSPQIDLNLPDYIQIVNKKDTVEGYVQIFENVYRNNSTIEDKHKIIAYVQNNFSRDFVMSNLQKSFFN